MEFELYPKVAHLLTSTDFAHMYVLLRRLRPVILRSLSHKENRQQLLPNHVANFITATTGLKAEVVSQCWPVMRSACTSSEDDIDYQRFADDMFRLHAPRFGHGQHPYCDPRPTVLSPFHRRRILSSSLSQLPTQ